jgi:hypothetical protein
MDFKLKAVSLLTKLAESKYLNKAETYVVGAINRLTADPKPVTTETKKTVVETI